MTDPHAFQLDRIALHGMEFHARHGVHASEAEFGARFVVDVELEVQVRGGDLLEETVDYSRVYSLVESRVTETRFRLIETLAVDLAERLLSGFLSVTSLTVRVHKPHAPLPGIVRDVFVEVTRRR